MVVKQSTAPSSSEPLALQVYALRELQFIRRTMESTGYFTAVPGWGLMIIGCTAIATAAIAAQAAQEAWLWVWMAEALLALLIGNVAMSWKAHRADVPLWSGVALRFMINLYVPILMSVPLTFALYLNGAENLLPGLWLMIYGTGVVTGGAFSVPVVRLMGVCFILLGVAALCTPFVWGDALMAFGFGGLHILYGSIIARKHGG